MTITALKAHAYDLLAAIQRLQFELQEVNKKIAEQEQSNGSTDSNINS